MFDYLLNIFIIMDMISPLNFSIEDKDLSDFLNITITITIVKVEYMDLIKRNSISSLEFNKPYLAA